MNPRKINRITLVLLALGFGSALAILIFARPAEVDPLLGDPLDSKKFVHDMQVIGGNANVVASEFSDWFRGLWHGRKLAGTVAVLTMAGTLAFRFVASHPDYADDASRADDSKRPPAKG